MFKRMLFRIVVVCLSLLFAAPSMAQQSLLERLQGSGSQGLAGQVDQQSGYGQGGLSSPGAASQGASGFQSIQGTTPEINNSRLRSGLASGTQDQRGSVEQLQRKLQEIQATRLQQQIQALQTDPREHNEFQDFILQATGRELPIFGLSLFRNVPSTFAPTDDVPVTSDYVVGPGDEVHIRAWGQIDVDFSADVSRDGNISVPKVGDIAVAGIKAKDLTSYLKTAFGRLYRNFELSANLGKLRSIQVFVVGQAKRPGTYTVSSLSTLVTAIFAAGGPSSKGSMRSIQLKRNNRVVTDFDLYDLLVAGDKSRDVQLVSGDVIYFPPVGPLVAVSGSVNVPGIYETKQSAALFDLIRWSGGLGTTAQGQKVTLERIEDRRVRKVEEFGLDATGLARTIRDGDLVTVYSIGPRFDNAVSLRGNVVQPGRYPWRAGMRIRDLIPDRESLLSRDYWQKRNQVVGLDGTVAGLLSQQSTTGTRLTVEDLNQRRKPDDDPERTIGDAIRRIQVESEASRFLDPLQTNSSLRASRPQDAARVQEPPRDEMSRLEAARANALRMVNQIRPSTQEINWDYAVIERINRDDLSSILIPFNLGKAVINGDEQNNILLQPGDIVTILSKDDVQTPLANQTRYIRIEGEFANAGVYQIQPGETLRQLVVRVGGLSANAYLFGAQFTRESTRIQQQKSLEEALNRLERDVQRANILRAQNVTTPEDAAALGSQAEGQRQLIERLRQIRPSGRIVLEIPEDGKLRDIPDLALEDGDRLYVPPPPSMISVFGSVYSENSFIYKPEKRVAEYLALAGGPTKAADKGSIYVLRADGSVISRQQSGALISSFEGGKLMPGDSIVVPEELDRTTWTRTLKDFAQIFYQFGLGAAAVKVLRQ